MNQSMMNRMDRKKRKCGLELLILRFTLFDQFGIDEVTMDQIAERLSCERNSVQLFFIEKIRHRSVYSKVFL
jgi:AcrR family transcriptional regulator